MVTKQVSLLNGSEIGKRHLEACRQKAEALKKQGRGVVLGTLQIGESKDAVVYSNYLRKILAQISIDLKAVTVAEKITQVEAIGELKKLNADPSVTGIMVFSPIPKHIDATALFDHIAPSKDVEGRTFLKSHFGVFSPTANSVMTLIEETGVDLKGKDAVVVGHSDLVGKPAAILLMDKYATVTVCHKETRELALHIQKADILVAAVGKPNIIKGEWIKPGAIVIDVGENIVDGKIIGDVEFEPAKNRAAFISPVPGGVGPLTNVMLIRNLIRLRELN